MAMEKLNLDKKTEIKFELLREFFQCKLGRQIKDHTILLNELIIFINHITPNNTTLIRNRKNFKIEKLTKDYSFEASQLKNVNSRFKCLLEEKKLSVILRFTIIIAFEYLSTSSEMKKIIEEQYLNWIKHWFNECEKLNIRPWEWDFKRSYTNEYPSSNIEFMQKYKEYKLIEIGLFNTTGKFGKDADCDKEPTPLYHLLWQIDKRNIIRGDTMNSFSTIFHFSINRISKEISRSNKIPPNKTRLLKKINKTVNFNQYNMAERTSFYEKYAILKKQFASIRAFSIIFDEFENFAKATHTIGNFIPFSHWLNTGRNAAFQDYWDFSLQFLYEQLSPLDAWENFITQYNLEPYVNENFTVKELFPGHLDRIEFNPKNNNELSYYLKNVNLKIEERGKLIIKKLCDKYNLKNYTFYEQL